MKVRARARDLLVFLFSVFQILFLEIVCGDPLESDEYE